MGTGNARFRSTRGWAEVPWGAHRACLGGTRSENTPCLGVPKDGTGHDRGAQGGDKLGKAHSRGGPAWLPGAVGHGLSGRDLERRPAEVRGSRPPPRWEPQASAQGARGGGEGGGGSRGGKSWGRRPRDPLLRDRVLEAAPRAPQPPPRAGPDFPALFTSEKLSRDLGCGVAPTKRPRPPRPYANEAKHNAPIGQGR